MLILFHLKVHVTSMFSKYDIAIFLSILLTTVNNSKEGQNTLLLAHVLFRHGERTPEIDEFYRNDPYKIYNYYPFGYGQLTNKGKRSMYELGKFLKRRYNCILGDYYSPGLIDAVSTPVDRTKMSLQLVLAGLFPPKGVQIWCDENINWQPIPYTVLTENNLHLLIPYVCPTFVHHHSKELEKEHAISFLKTYSNQIEYIAKYSGEELPICNPSVTYSKMKSMYAALQAEKSFDLVLPAWTCAVFPDFFDKVVNFAFSLMSCGFALKSLGCSALLEKIMNSVVSHMKGESTEILYLYSAHDVTVATFLNSLSLNCSRTPEYGAAIFLELHRINSILGMKIFYKKNSREKPELLRLPKCECFCPFDKFFKLLSPLFPYEKSYA